MNFSPTTEQEEILSAVRHSTDNLMLVARAGAAKTTTLEMIAEQYAVVRLVALGWFSSREGWHSEPEGPAFTLTDAYLASGAPKDQILCLAFNAAIAKEMSVRLPPNCVAKTMHSLGLAAWRTYLGKFPKTDKDKLYRRLKIESEKADRADQEELKENFAETLSYLREGKNLGWVPESYSGHWRPLCTDLDFFASLATEPTPLQRSLLIKISAASWKETLAGTVDFDDMILAPAICSVTFPFFSIVMVDEAQDLSPLNHAILRKVARRSRLIAVGDPCQAIYGFRGALEESIPQLAEKFSCTTLYLTTTFRCAKAIVAEALWRAPDMLAFSTNPAGLVSHLSEWTLSSVPDSAVILCRTNAPLYKLAMKLLQSGRYPELIGRDFTKGLVSILSKLGGKTLRQADVHARIDAWEEKELARSRSSVHETVRDKAACLRTFASMGDTLADAVLYAETVLHREGKIKLMTGHKSKGLEFEKVFILNRSLIKMTGQNPNILYVMQTRAKTELSYIEMEALED